MLFRFFERAVDPYPKDVPTQPPSSLFAFIWHYAAPFKWLFLGSIIFSAAIAGLEVYAFELVGSIIDWMTEGSPETFWSEHFWQMAAIFFLFIIIWPLMTLGDDLILLQGILANMAMQTRWRGHRYLLRQSTTFFANEFAGRISTKLMQTSLGVREVLIKLTNLMVYMVVYFATSLYLFGSNSIWLGVPLIVWLCLYALTMWIFLPRLKNWSEKMSDARSVLTGRIVDAYTNIHTVKLFASSSAEEKYAKDSMDAFMDTAYPMNQVITAMSFMLHSINGLFIASTVGVGAFLWTENIITIGALAFAGTMVLRIQGMSHYFLWEMAGLFENIGSAIDGMKTLSKPIAVEDAKDAKTLVVKDGKVEFDDVTFQYGSDQRVVSDLSLEIKPGEKVGLVGRSGAGKSTLVNLLLRLYDVEAGKIRIDGQAIDHVSQDSLREKIAVVTQDTSLLHRSIRENIAYGRPEATDKEIIAAAEKAEAWDFIQSLEDPEGRQGLEAHVGERGVKLSGGQRQRIAIARVVLKDAPILILDEATSALDSEVEAAIQSQLETLMEGKSVMAIAHRLSTIAAMDRLIVLEKGQIAEQGTHEELIAAGGLYAQLWARQSGGFIDAEETVAAE